MTIQCAPTLSWTYVQPWFRNQSSARFRGNSTRLVIYQRERERSCLHDFEFCVVLPSVVFRGTVLTIWVFIHPFVATAIRYCMILISACLSTCYSLPPRITYIWIWNQIRGAIAERFMQKFCHHVSRRSGKCRIREWARWFQRRAWSVGLPSHAICNAPYWIMLCVATRPPRSYSYFPRTRTIRLQIAWSDLDSMQSLQLNNGASMPCIGAFMDTTNVIWFYINRCFSTRIMGRDWPRRASTSVFLAVDCA